jgi:hypothetical protein
MASTAPGAWATITSATGSGAARVTAMPIAAVTASDTANAPSAAPRYPSNCRNGRPVKRPLEPHGYNVQSAVDGAVRTCPSLKAVTAPIRTWKF